MELTKIDVHHHVLPMFFREAQTAGGYPSTAYRAFPDWTEDKSLTLMDRQGIKTSVMSFSAPGIHFGDQDKTNGLARRCNDYLAELRVKHPGRFGGFASLPLPDPDAACRELERIHDDLGLQGVIHLTQVDDRYLGHTDYAPLYDEMHRRGTVVFLHPTYPPDSAERDHIVPRPIVDYPCETLRAISNMMFAGGLERWPDIKFILSHAGGALPALAHRISLFDKLTPHGEKYPDGALAYLKRLYYDTALSGDPVVLTAITSVVGTGQMLFGTDYPYVPDEIADGETAGTDAFTGFDGAARTALESGTAEALLPGL